MKISIVMAVYNGKGFLSDQLDSLRSQTTGADEVIISDDHSTDDSVAAIKGYISAHALHSWRLIENETNVGYILNFRRGLAEAAGDIVFLSDQDDIWLPQKIEDICKVFKEDPNVLAVCSNYDTMDETSNIDTAGIDRVNSFCPLSHLLRANPSPGCTCAYRRSVVEEYLAMPECAVPHDWALNIIAAYHGGLYILNSALTLYRQHSGNLIGLKGPGHGLKMTTPIGKRREILDMQIALSNCFCSIPGLGGKDRRLVGNFKKYCENRRRALDEHSVCAALRNFFLYPSVKGIGTVSSRGLAGDLICALCRSEKEQIK